jgi:hypothetical protein
MSKMGKILSLLIVLSLAISIVITAQTVSAQSAPKPAIPQFTVRYVNASQSVTNTNPYTGAKELQLIDNNSIEVTIDNQPWSYSNSQIYYNIRVRPHFASSENWTEIYPLRNLTSAFNNGEFSYAEYISSDTPLMPNSGHFMAYFPVVVTQYYGESGYDVQRYYSGDEGQEGEYFAFLHGIPYGSQLDFQVEALVGHEAQVFVNDHPLAPMVIGHYETAHAFDITSGWSNTQTTGISSVPEFPSLPSLLFLMLASSIAIVIFRRRIIRS